MKTVAITLNTTWNIYNFRLGLIKALQKSGYRVIAIAPKDEYVKKLEQENVEFYDIKLNNKGINPLEEIKLIFNFYRIYKELKPDIILQYTIKPNIYGSFASYLLDIPVINNISGLGTVFLNDRISSKIARYMYKFALKIPKKVFFQNSDDMSLFIEKKIVSSFKVELLPGSGINTKKFSPVDKKGDDNKIRFIMIARLVYDKGLKEYLKASELLKNRYKNVEFFLLGAFYPGNPTAITKEELDIWIDKGVITYLGISDNVKEEIAKVDCVVLPSYREGLSRVLLEAASMAKPIVTTNVPGCKNVVDDGVNGYLCNVKDYVDLAKSMEKIINLSQSKRKEMGIESRKKALKEFDERIVFSKYLNSITQIASFSKEKNTMKKVSFINTIRSFFI